MRRCFLGPNSGPKISATPAGVFLKHSAVCHMDTHDRLSHGQVGPSVTRSEAVATVDPENPHTDTSLGRIRLFPTQVLQNRDRATMLEAPSGRPRAAPSLEKDHIAQPVARPVARPVACVVARPHARP